MPQRRKSKRKQPPRRGAKPTTGRLKATLAKCRKVELLDVIVELAKSDRAIQRQLETRFGVKVPPEDLIADTYLAISQATEFDEPYTNDYDYQAYGTVKRHFARLVKLGRLRETMDLSRDLMDKGSYQVEMSDEAMMTDDIEECLRVVTNAIKKSDLPAADVAAWCADMRRRDRVGFLCDDELAALAKKVNR